MVAENTGEESLNERLDERSLSIQGSVNDSTVVVGDRTTIQQGPSYYINTVFSFFRAEQSPEQLKHLGQQLLQQMKTNIAKRLEDSLHNLIRVGLEAEEQRHQVGRRKKLPLVEVAPSSNQDFDRLVERELVVSPHSKKRKSIPLGEGTYEILQRSDIGGRLLILGEPGAGKTTELLTVAQRLVEAAIEDDTQPIPLVFELSSWTPDVPILKWLGQQLQLFYGVSKKLAEPLTQQWVQQTRILLLLDGLDELGQRNQVNCIKALENFLAQHPALPVVVCCRREDYEQGKARLKQLNGAIYLQAVGTEQIQQYLKDLDREPLWDGIEAEPELLKLAKSPLFLTMLVVVYEGQPITEQSALLNAYVQKQLQDPSYQGADEQEKAKSPQKTLHYLRWLAEQITERKETEFLIENIQPDWLSSERQEQIYRLSSGLTFGLLFGLAGGLCGSVYGSLSNGLFFGFSGGFLLGTVYASEKIEPKEYLRWNLRQGIISGIISAVGGELILCCLGGLVGEASFRSTAGLTLGPAFGVVCGLFLGLNNEAIEQKQVPNQGIKASLRNGLIIGLLCGLVSGLVFSMAAGLSIGLPVGIGVGLSIGLNAGLGDALQHLILRILLTRSEHTPWNYAKFLERATQYRFIQSTGGRYRFVHDLLRQHFASMTPEQQALLTQAESGNRP